MPSAFTIALIPLLPLLGFVLLGCFGRQVFRKYSGILATTLLFGATIIACFTAYRYFFHEGSGDAGYESLVPLKLTWLQFGEGLSIDMGIMLDPVAVMMLVVVTFVSLMVHIYSLSYMKGEERFPTYFAFLSLFTFSMLGLVISSNIFQLYIFWELVGLSSFLLIGYHYDRPSAVAASKKAFIVTRFADLGFLVGILVLSYFSNSLDFPTLIQRLTDPGSDELKAAVSSSFLGVSALTWGMLLVFMGGAGKSAMFPLHIWLPDAMEGPTPVSALIHAATMVVAGVFLVARLFPVYALSAGLALDVVAVVGAVSALLAAVIACAQTDIKRVLAYSTMSQIGFMMFALGVSGYGESGYTASQFHLFTHALFKALLFLGAGVVIHYVHSNEMRDMGGLRRQLPLTHVAFLIGCLAIAGIPPFAGFFSKEQILEAAHQNNRAIYWTALVTSGLTAFYMFRLYFSVFWNRPTHPGKTHGREGSVAMLLPLVILATAAATAGFIPFGEFVSSDGKPVDLHLQLSSAILPVMAALGGISLAAWFFLRENDRAARAAFAVKGLYRLARNKFYIDEIWLFLTRKIVFGLIGRPTAWFDKYVVDGLVNLTGNSTALLSEKIKTLQSGRLQQYALWFLAGAIGLVVLFIYVWK
ncbi:MAG TPA: NADH-quinone oxidoreductase subunit L [Chitinophagaceae bacterium]|nr:NADH-quinone oxidoreductase subunit L [Chitinophagaceae bacterium]